MLLLRTIQQLIIPSHAARAALTRELDADPANFAKFIAASVRRSRQVFETSDDSAPTSGLGKASKFGRLSTHYCIHTNVPLCAGARMKRPMVNQCSPR